MKESDFFIQNFSDLSRHLPEEALGIGLDSRENPFQFSSEFRANIKADNLDYPMLNDLICVSDRGVGVSL